VQYVEEAMKLTCLACGQANRVPDDALGRGPKCAVCGAGLLPDHPVEVDAATLDKAARGDGLPLIVDFWAPWCGPCRSMAPEFAKAAQGFAGRARFVKLNTEAEPAAGARHNIRAIPTMVKFAGGREVARQSGAMPARAIADWAAG
jgi:thioredoxin 2